MTVSLTARRGLRPDHRGCPSVGRLQVLPLCAAPRLLQRTQSRPDARKYAHGRSPSPSPPAFTATAPRYYGLRVRRRCALRRSFGCTGPAACAEIERQRTAGARSPGTLVHLADACIRTCISIMHYMHKVKHN